ncbi:MAG: DUF58 domain-containing protein [Pseudomonadota bacterium]
MTDLATLRAEAEELALALADVSLKAQASEAPHIGSAGRRRAGTGEHFWQYRRYAHEDSADRIDWRRSARGSDLYVRETELETARTVLCWCDPHPGFEWSSDTLKLKTKANEARMLMLAISTLLSRDGERIGALGSGRSPSFGASAVDRLAEDLTTDQPTTMPMPPSGSAMVVIASDFYDPIDVWLARLSPVASKCKEGVILAVHDPVEANFPFEGRVKLSRPGVDGRKLLGRAESVRAAYLQKFGAQRQALRDLTARFGWRMVEHQTGTLPLKAATDLKQALESYTLATTSF